MLWQQYELANVIAIVVDGITTFVWADVLPSATVETATYVTADVFVVADGMATFVTGWCYWHCGRWNSHWLEWFQGRSYNLGGRC